MLTWQYVFLHIKSCDMNFWIYTIHSRILCSESAWIIPFLTSISND